METMAQVPQEEHAVEVTEKAKRRQYSAAYWLAGTGSASTDAVTGPFDALGRLTAEQWDSGAVAKSNSFLAGSNLPGSYSTTLTGTATNVYSASSMRWQGNLLTSYTVSSAWEGGGTSYGAVYDADAHLQSWSAAPLGAAGSATQQFNETYAFNVENIKQINATNSLGLNTATTYQYDPASKERVTSMTTPGASLGDYFSYDRRGRGLITAHRLSSGQNPPQDSYEYDSLGRLISISRLG